MADKTIVALLSEVSNAVGSVAKREENTTQHFNFRGIDAVVNAVSPEFRKAGIIVAPTVLKSSYESVEVGQKRTPMGHAMLETIYTFYGPAGDKLEATVASEAMDSGDKAVAKAMSVGFRTALLQVLTLPTDEPDPDAETFERSAVSFPADFVNQIPGREHAEYKGMTLAQLGTTEDGHAFIVWLSKLSPKADSAPAQKASTEAHKKAALDFLATDE